MHRVAGAANAWTTSYPMTGSTYVATTGVREENISATTNVLGMPFHLPTNLRQWIKTNVITLQQIIVPQLQSFAALFHRTN